MALHFWFHFYASIFESKLFKKRVVRSNVDIYVFINNDLSGLCIFSSWFDFPFPWLI